MEQKRGCGFRKVGGTYLVGEYIPIPCDRLPYPLPICPVCHSGLKVGRGMGEINPLALFGSHENCADEHQPCPMCQPSEKPAYLMLVGEKFYPTPADFLNEGIKMGFSKRIARIPRHFELGKTVVYLAHHKACVVEDTEVKEVDKEHPKMVEVDRVKRATGIFTAFIPQRIEKMYWESTLKDMPKREMQRLKRMKITPVGLPEDEKFR